MGYRNEVISSIEAKKKRGQKITMLTAYDYPTGRMVDRAGIDAVLVGDSLGMVVLGYETTRKVTMDDMLHHARAVRKGVERALLVGDMPYMSCEPDEDAAVRNARRFIREAGCDAVKVEGGTGVVSRIEAIIADGIPVMGHVGLTPQSVDEGNGFKVKGRGKEDAEKIIKDAAAVQGAGCFSVVLECVPAVLAGKITAELTIPTIGIGAGPSCDGQVLVIHDLLGMFDKFVPKFVKRYADLNAEAVRAIEAFKQEVESGEFPSADSSF
ncbi:MAG: 3-methyl-2-oxobutanoate hydroxymethyltransferase [Candidatus Omnitrophica bacterium]|nr:3-methyl-2-oxobutanoate hydroxymethyltransferase [Candidatus Omnitrophota bacterium]